jgi:hypothetical protein
MKLWFKKNKAFEKPKLSYEEECFKMGYERAYSEILAIFLDGREINLNCFQALYLIYYVSVVQIVKLRE